MNMMKKIVLAFLITSTSLFSLATSNQQLADSAQVFFMNAQYQKSIQAYEKIVSNGEESAALFYNLGNAYFKTKNIPLAIANYERAKSLNPNDEDITFNLHLAQTQTVDKIETLPPFFLSSWVNAFTKIFSTNVWAYLSVLAFVLSLAFLLYYLFTSSILVKKMTFWSASIMLLVSLLSMASSYNQKKINFDTQYAIITNPSVNIKSSPDENSTSIFILHSGTKLQVLDQIQDWYKIKIENGNTGWIKLADVEEV